MTRTRVVVAAGVAALGIVLSAAGAGAGGWATSSLDAVPVPVAGEEIEVGFTIRQHGVTPVNPDDQGAEPVAVVVRPSSGGERSFPARQEGPAGHYAADVTFPEAGQAHWSIRQGWFGAYDLGTIEVADAPTGDGAAVGGGEAGEDDTLAAGAPPGGTAHRWPPTARTGAVVVAAGGAAVAVADARRSRRGRAAEVAGQ